VSDRRLLAVVAVEAEAKALGALDAVEVLVAGIGRTNAAAATMEGLLERGPFAAVCSVGVAGALPGGSLGIGDLVVASESIYVEEGIETPEGFGDMTVLGFALGDFQGNRVPGDAALLDRIATNCPGVSIGPVATVATCSGTDRRATVIAKRTGAIAEAMEGAAVVHAARRRGIPAVEIRVVSNTTGDRHLQRWDLPTALRALEGAWLRIAESMLREG